MKFQNKKVRGDAGFIVMMCGIMMVFVVSVVYYFNFRLMMMTDVHNTMENALDIGVLSCLLMNEDEYAGKDIDPDADVVNRKKGFIKNGDKVSLYGGQIIIHESDVVKNAEDAADNPFTDAERAVLIANEAYATNGGMITNPDGSATYTRIGIADIIEQQALTMADQTNNSGLRGGRFADRGSTISIANDRIIRNSFCALLAFTKINAMNGHSNLEDLYVPDRLRNAARYNEIPTLNSTKGIVLSKEDMEGYYLGDYISSDVVLDEFTIYNVYRKTGTETITTNASLVEKVLENDWLEDDARALLERLNTEQPDWVDTVVTRNTLTVPSGRALEQPITEVVKITFTRNADGTYTAKSGAVYDNQETADDNAYAVYIGEKAGMFKFYTKADYDTALANGVDLSDYITGTTVSAKISFSMYIVPKNADIFNWIIDVSGIEQKRVSLTKTGSIEVMRN